MKRLLYAVSAFALLVPAAAVAQNQDNQHGGRGGGHQAHQGGGGGAQHQSRGGGRPSAPAAQAPQTAQAPRGNRSVTQTVQEQRGGRSFSGQRANVQTVSNQRYGGRTGNVRRVQASPFRYPSGYSYRRWSAGSILPSIFLSNYYFYNSWASVGAYPPPRGYVWVRYGPDLLLVSRRSGRIRDVLYGVFY